MLSSSSSNPALKIALVSFTVVASLTAADVVLQTQPSQPSQSAIAVKAWMSWDGGVDLVGMTKPGLTAPNLILHVARQVHTPVGSAASGIVMYQPEPSAPPVVFGFVSENPQVGAYFGPMIFAGTPFEKAPVLPATITIETAADHASSRIAVAGHVFTVRLAGLAPATLVGREPGPWPFAQRGVEAVPNDVTVTFDGAQLTVIVPPVDPVRGPSAVFAVTGIYTR